MADRSRRGPPAVPTIAIGETRLPVVVRRLAHARRMTLRLAPDGGAARVSMPRWGRAEDALAFARAGADWLAGQIAALPPAQPVLPGGTLRYRDQSWAIVHDPRAPRRPALRPGAIVLGGPGETLAARLRRWLEREAMRLLADDLGDYCARAGVASPGLALSRARRRWGSCASSGAIRINWRLVMAPDAVRRSVVAHEVAHLLHFDHSALFRACLSGLFEGDLAATDAWLRRHGPELYAPFG